MTIVQPSYHTSPNSNSTTEQIPLPNGTIYMFGLSGSLDTVVKPFPTCGYFPDFETCLKASLEWVGTNDIKPKYVKDIFGGMCKIYTVNGWMSEAKYIYVWAIAPAGGVA